MVGGRRLVDALHAVATRYGPDDRKDKLRLLEALETERPRDPGSLPRPPETLGSLQAYPDDPDVLGRVDRALAEFPERVARLGPAARRYLHDSGIANAPLDYPFGYPMARWVA